MEQPPTPFEAMPTQLPEVEVVEAPADAGPVDSSTATEHTYLSTQRAPEVPQDLYEPPTPPAQAAAEVSFPEVPTSDAAPQAVQPEIQALATDQVARTASPTLAAIFANMPQPKTDIDAGSSLAESTFADPAAPSEQIADRVLDVTGQQISEVPVPAPAPAPAPAVRQEMATVQLGREEIESSDVLPLQRRSTYRPVDLARTEYPQQPEAPQQELSEESIDSVFSQLQQPTTDQS